MKRILLIVVLCALYDIASFEYGRHAGTDTMFASFLLPILTAVILYTLLVYYLTYHTTTLNDSIIRKHILRAPLYLYIAFHAFMLLILIVTGISAVFQNL
jgi:hypothetical protein